MPIKYTGTNEHTIVNSPNKYRELFLVIATASIKSRHNIYPLSKMVATSVQQK
jgi:hypothetical protein